MKEKTTETKGESRWHNYFIGCLVGTIGKPY
jgi:hypothetical protein